MEIRSCPCLYVAPCRSDCTCVRPASSAGCLRCCTYGSPEQQRAAAEWIARVLDEAASRVQMWPRRETK